MHLKIDNAASSVGENLILSNSILVAWESVVWADWCLSYIIASSKCFLQEASLRGAFPRPCALAFFPPSRNPGNYFKHQG